MTTILISILAYIAVGIYVGRKVKGIEDYMVVGRQAPTLLIVGTLVASFLSTSTFLGNTGMAYGINAGVWILFPGIAFSGYIYGAIFFGRYLRRSRSLTIAEYFGRRFESRSVQLAAGVTVIIGIGCYLIAVTQGAAIILSNLTELTYTQSLIIAWLSYTSFTLYSGSKGVVITDTMMFMLFIAVSVFALAAILQTQGGWLTALNALVTQETKPELMSWHGVVGPGKPWVTPTDLLIWVVITQIAWSLVIAISPWQASRYLMAKNEHVVMRSACIAPICIICISTMLYAAAAAVNLSKTDIDPNQEVMIWAALNLMPPLLGSLLLAGIVAAALSSATTFLSLVGFNVSNDMMHRSHRNDASALRYSRKIMLLVSLVTLVIALMVKPQIFWLTFFAGPLFASAWGPVAFMSVWSKKITAAAALWGMAAGFFGNIIPKVLDSVGLIDLPSYLDPILLGAVTSLVVIVWVSGRTVVSDTEKAYRKILHEIPDEDISDRETRKTIFFAYAIGLFGVLGTIVLIVFYVIPYQSAIALAGTHPAYDWFSVEAIFAYCWSVVFLSCAVLMRHTARVSYG